MDNGKTLILLSGGPDSAVAAYHALSQGREIMAITLKSEPRGHNLTEVNCAIKMAKKLSIPHEVVDVSFLTSFFQDKPNYKFAVGGARDCLPEGLRVAPLSVEFMHMIASMYAINHGIHSFVWSIHKKDIDYDTEWEMKCVDHYEKLISLRTNTNFKFEMPFLNMTKSEVLQLGHKLGVPFDETFSCFTSLTEDHCGNCYKCHERRTQFKLAGVEDKVTYLKDDDFDDSKVKYRNVPTYAYQID